MKTMKRFGALCCASALVLTLAACNSSREASVAEILADAEQKISEAKSMEANLTTELDTIMTIDGETTNRSSSDLMNIVLFNTPIKIKINLIRKMESVEPSTEEETVKMDVYLVEKNSNYNMYYNDGAGWITEPVDMNFVQLYNPKTDLQIYLKNIDSFKKDGVETINDVKATKYTGMMKGEVMEELMKSSGALDGIDLGEWLEDTDLNVVFSEIEDMPISVWINEKGYPIRWEINMKDAMNIIYEKINEQMGEKLAGYQMVCTRLLVSTDCFNYDKAAEFEIPAEAMQ